MDRPQIEHALKLISDLNNNRRQWLPLRVPPDPEHDCDLVFTRLIVELEKEIDSLTKERDDYREQILKWKAVI